MSEVKENKSVVLAAAPGLGLGAGVAPNKEKKSDRFKASDAEIKACPGYFLPANAARFIGMYKMYNSKVLVITQVRFLFWCHCTHTWTPTGVCRL